MVSHMRKILILFMGIALVGGCNKLSTKPGIIVEANSPIIGREYTLVESLGIETSGGVFTPLIIVGQKVPAEISNVFSMAADNQDQIKLRLYRGTAKMAAQNTFLGEFQIVGIPPAPRGTANINVTLRIADAEIRLSAKDLKSDNYMNIKRVAPQPGGAAGG